MSRGIRWFGAAGGVQEVDNLWGESKATRRRSKQKREAEPEATPKNRVMSELITTRP